MSQFKSKGHLLVQSLLIWGGQAFVLFGSSTDWLRPTHILEGNLLSPQPTQLNVNLTQNHPPRNLQNND